jgi:NAD-dependent DNA ligase
MSMSQYANYADYHASLTSKSPGIQDRRRVGGTEPLPEGERRADLLARLQVMNDEIQRDKDAALWRKLVAMGIADAGEAIACSHTMADFVKRITEQ